MKRPLVILVVPIIAASTLLASAATLGGVSGRLDGAGNVAVARCDSNGFTVSYTLTGSNITAVVVGDIADPECEGAAARVTLTSSAGASVSTGGPVTVPTDAGTAPNSVTVSVTSVAETTVVGVQISVIGP